MRELKALDIEKSIKFNKLIFDESWLDIIDRLVHYLIFSWGFILPFLIYFDPNRDINKTGTEYYLVFIFSLFCLYVIYRKATEKKLIKVIGDSSTEKNKEIINNYFSKLGFEKFRNSKNLIIYNSDNAFGWDSKHKVSRIFMFEENQIYFTIIKNGYRLNFPVLFSQLILKKELSKLFV